MATPYTQVRKRDGTLEDVSFDKITERIRLMIEQEPRITTINPITITQKISHQIYQGIDTSELDDLACKILMDELYLHPDNGVLASRIAIDNHQKNTKSCILEVAEILMSNIDLNGESAPMLSQDVYETIQSNFMELNQMIEHSRDYEIDFFGFKTLQRSYLLKINQTNTYTINQKDKIIERPQHLWMRVAIAIHGSDLTKVKLTYDNLSQKYFIHATPTLFHAGTPRPQMSSCFLMGTDDSVEGIFKTISDTAMISKWAGGVGIHISNIRANNSYIRKTAGHSLGIMPMLKVYNDTARYINQSGRRNGSFAMYLEPWHADVFQFLEAKKNHGAEEERARDLFYAMWIPDYFMRAVESDSEWYLMCPDQSPGLPDCYGDDFEKLYDKYVADGKFIKKIKARDLWQQIINSQIETGTPYMLYKDTINRCSNQKNIGVIKSSNLCTEIVEYSDATEYAVCNLGSINLSNFLQYPKPNWLYPGGDRWGIINNIPEIIIYTADECSWCNLLKALMREHNIRFEERELERDMFGNIVWPELFKKHGLNTVPRLFADGEHIGGYDIVWNTLKPIFNFDELHKVTQILTDNLNKIIDLNFYPVPETERSNKRHRPIGIGVQGLADVFMKMKLPFDSEEARKLNANIHEIIYHAALTQSCKLAISEGPYETFKGSPMSEGLFQFNMWALNNQTREIQPMTTIDWEDLRDQITTHGLRNSLLVAPMPTASTSQILGNNECFEPYTSNIYTRRVLAGEFTVVNKHLIRDLINLGIWDNGMANTMIEHRGSIQEIESIPVQLKAVYKTAWELKQKVLMTMSRDRGFYVDQSQSLNLFFPKPTYNILSNAHLWGWKNGLKTGSYYIRSKPAISSQQFTVAVKSVKSSESRNNEPCELCSA